MDENKKKILSDILHKSMENIGIKNQMGERAPSVEQYKSLYLRKRESANEIIFYQRYGVKWLPWYGVVNVPDIKDDSIKSELVDFLKDELKEYVEGDYIVSCLSVSTPNYSLNDLLQSVLKVSMVWGVEKAVSVFEQCVDKKSSIPIKRFALIEGVINQSEMEIFEGIRLMTGKDLFVDCPNCREEFLLQDRGVGFAHNGFIVADYSLSPIFVKPSAYQFFQPSPFQEKLQSTEINKFDFVSFCNILSLVSNNRIRPMIVSDYVMGDMAEFGYLTNDDVALGGFLRNKYQVYERDRSAMPVSISKEQMEEAKSLYLKVYDSNRKEFDLLRTVVIPRWVKAKKFIGGRFYVDDFIDLGIALESLYVPDSGSGEISFKLRTRASCHLGANVEEKMDIFRKFKAIYDQRSRAVHRGEVEKKVKIGGKDTSISSVLESAQDLCRESILKVIEAGGVPDWDSLVVSGGQTPTPSITSGNQEG
ncbi:MAG: HEPN domain-containing protein [Candidatus Dadabacteria bacterium]|nr:HEPN domain-containing protein [Candidatus Dadabacteria bacterium]